MENGDRNNIHRNYPSVRHNSLNFQQIYPNWNLIPQVLLAIGGWAFGSTPFKELTSNVFRMNQFVYEAIEFLRDYQFNGLDIDWEYPR